MAARVSASRTPIGRIVPCWPARPADSLLSPPSDRRNLPMRIARIAAGLAIALGLMPLAASAQSNWPDRPIHIIVPFTAGSGTEIIARLVAEPLAKSLG